MIGKLCLTLESTAKSVVKTVAAQQKSFNSLAKVVLNNRLALDYLLAEQGGVWAVASTTCCHWVNTSGEVEIQVHEITEQTIWLEKVTPSMGSFFDLLDFDWFGS